MAISISAQLNCFNWIAPFVINMPSSGKDETESENRQSVLSAVSRKIPSTTGRSKQSQEETLCRCMTAEPWICSSWQRWHGYQLLHRGDACKCTSHQISHVLAAPCMSPSEDSKLPVQLTSAFTWSVSKRTLMGESIKRHFLWILYALLISL